jgi:two-component system NtrC family sensor kinase
VSLRWKLALAFVIVVLLANVVLAPLVIHAVENLYLEAIQSRVRLDMNAARVVYDHAIGDITRLLQTASVRRPIALPEGEAVDGDPEGVLRTLRREGGLDILTLLDPGGRVVYRVHRPDRRGDDLSTIPVVAKALKERRAVGGTFVIPREALQNDGQALAERAKIEIAETAKFVTDGIAIGAAVPVSFSDSAATMRGVLYGAKLLNRRSDLVDRIRQAGYRALTYEGKDVGVATVFLGDVRIATSHRTDAGRRPVGTVLDEPIRERVLGSGRAWADRARVVDDWYFTAYEPIRDPGGRVIGALGLALLEAPFTQPQSAHLTYFLVIVCATSIGTVIFLVLLTRVATQPMQSIVDMSRKVIAGDLTARVGMDASAELATVGAAVDRMAEAIAEREMKLEEATRRQISRSEKLASIGRLAAGIAHEINNPLTGVLMFAHLLQEKGGRDGEDARDLEVIVRETERVRGIVRSLLDFARQSAPSKELLDMNRVVQDTVKLVRKQAERGKVVIDERLDGGLPPVLGDRNQLAQVFVNLALNAIEAMPAGGLLTVSTGARDGRVVIVFSDTGCGIKAEDLDRVFDPFFTTKPPGEGTGLGLSVSYGTVEQHGGDLTVQSREGEGTTMTVVLPIHELNVRPDGAPA